MSHGLANVLVVSALVSFTLAFISYRRRSSPGAKELAVVMVSLGIWAFMYALRWVAEQPSDVYFWLNMAYFGIFLAPPAMLLFSLQFTRRSHEITRQRVLLLTVEPIISLILLWTDPTLGWFFGGLRNANSVFGGGIWCWFNAVYSFTLMILSVFILYKFAQQSPDIARQQSRIIMAGFLIPIIICTFELSGLRPFPQMDLTPFTFILSGFLVLYGFSYHHLLDIAPIAYSKLVQTSTNALIVLDEQMRIVDMNPSSREMFKSVSGKIGEPATEIFAPWPDILTALVHRTESTHIIQMMDKSERNYEVSIFPLEDPQNKAEGWFLNFHDITRYKQTEDALTTSENKIRSLFHAITDIVFILDQEGRYLEVAPTNPTNLARDPGLLLGKTVFDVFPEEEAKIILNTVQQALKTGKMVQVDYPMVIDGREFWYAGNVTPLSNNSIIWVARDITERKRLEQSLRETGTRLEMAQNIAGLGNWEYDLATGILWASAEFFKILGMEPVAQFTTREELEKHFTFSKNPESGLSLPTVNNEPAPFEADVEIFREGEIEPRILHLVTTIINDLQDKPIRSSGVVQDITKQKQIEKALEKRVLALTRPLEKTGDIAIEDLFNLEDLQKLQDDFAKATGVASLICHNDGTLITQQSNFCRLCSEIIRKNETAGNECIENDAELSRIISDHAIIYPCPSIGLLHAGAPITVGGQQIASWLIGQVRTEDYSETALLNYVQKHGLNKEEALTAFHEIPTMSKDQFMAVAQSLFTFSTQLSKAAFQNIQQARFISDLKQVEEALKNSENKLRSLFQAMTDVIIIYDAKGCYREIAPTGSQRYYRPPAELLNKSITDVFPPDISSLFLKTIHQTLKLKEMSRLDYKLEIGGREYWFSANISPLTDDSVIWVARDITDRKKVEDSLHYQSMHDILTGLYNRQYYETEVERLQRSRLFPVSILVMDVDGLKWVNDHRGHNAGDELLQRVAGLLKSSFRPEDLVARMGGDEFVVVLPETDEPAAQQILQRLEDTLARHNQLFPSDQRLGLSIGSATGGQGILLTEVFKQADQAMYIKKSKKKDLATKEGTIPL